MNCLQVSLIGAELLSIFHKQPYSKAMLLSSSTHDARPAEQNKTNNKQQQQRSFYFNMYGKLKDVQDNNPLKGHTRSIPVKYKIKCKHYSHYFPLPT